MTLVALDEDRAESGVWAVRADDGRRFAVFALPDGYRVTDLLCPHQLGPLTQGEISDGNVLTCAWHHYRYDLDTGDCLTQRGLHLGVYPVVERDGRLFADVGEKVDPFAAARPRP